MGEDEIHIEASKDAGATYQRLMVRVCKDQIGRNMEVYVDDMVIKFEAFDQHLTNLKDAFRQLRSFGMRLNQEKCVFRVEGGKFLGFILTQSGIQANSDKCSAVLANAKPYKFEGSTKSCGKINISISFFAYISRED